MLVDCVFRRIFQVTPKGVLHSQKSLCNDIEAFELTYISSVSRQSSDIEEESFSVGPGPHTPPVWKHASELARKLAALT